MKFDHTRLEIYFGPKPIRTTDENFIKLTKSGVFEKLQLRYLGYNKKINLLAAKAAQQRFY